MTTLDKTQKLDELVGSVEELLTRLPDSLGPTLTALRDRVDDGIFDAWTAISNERIHAERLRGGRVSNSAGLGVLLSLAAAAVLYLRLESGRGTRPQLRGRSR